MDKINKICKVLFPKAERSFTFLDSNVLFLKRRVGSDETTDWQHPRSARLSGIPARLEREPFHCSNLNRLGWHPEHLRCSRLQRETRIGWLIRSGLSRHNS